IAEWLVDRLSGRRPVIVGIDHAFSFPLPYFSKYVLSRDWSAFLDDFEEHWPTDDDATSVEMVRRGTRGNGAARCGESRWRRRTDLLAGAAKSVFHYDVQGSVAKSTHAGLPWLRHIRRQVGDQVHFWPFDGWDVPLGRSAVVEVYPALWSRSFERESR